MDKMNLYDYVFWYNSYEDLWYAIHRDSELDFFGGKRKKAKYYSSKVHGTLVSILVKDGLAEKLSKSNSSAKKK